MVRVGSLLNESKLDPAARENKTELTAEEQVNGILEVVKPLYKECSVVFSRLKAELAKNRNAHSAPQRTDDPPARAV